MGSQPDQEGHPLASLAPEVASTVVRVAGDIAMVVGEDGVIRNVAEPDQALHGGSAQDWVGRAWTDVVTVETRRKVELLLQEAQQQGWSRRRELNHPGASGVDIPLSWAAVRLGTRGPMLAIGRDLRAVGAIQQRFLHAQQALERDYWQRRQTEGHYRLMFQVASDAVLMVDAHSAEVLEANRAAGDLFGATDQPWQGQTLRQYIDEALRPALDDLLANTRTTGRPAEVRLRVAGSAAPVDVSATPMLASGRRCLLLRARRAAPGTGDTQAVLDFVRQTPDALVVTDAAGRVLWTNPAFDALCRTPDPARLRGVDLAQALGGQPRPWTALLARVRARGIVGRTVLRLQRPGSPELVCEVTAALLTDADQEHLGFTLRTRPRHRAAPPPDDLMQHIGMLVSRLGQAALPELVAQATAVVEKQLISAALQHAGRRIDGAAELLRLSSAQLVVRMLVLDMPLPADQGEFGIADGDLH